MYAVVDIKGFQYKLEKGDILRVPKFDLEVGKKVKFSEVLLIADGEKVSVGKPYIEGAVVEATITDHDKYDKIIVFKKKRRKDYSVKRGHRQEFSEISVDRIKISASRKSKKAAEETSEPAKEVPEIPDILEAAVTSETQEAPGAGVTPEPSGTPEAAALSEGSEKK